MRPSSARPAPANISAGHRNGSSSGGSETTRTPPLRSSTPAQRAVIGGAAKLRAVTASNAPGARVPSARTSSESTVTWSVSDSARIAKQEVGPTGTTLDQRDRQVGPANRNHQTRQPAPRAEIGEGAGCEGQCCNKLIGVCHSTGQRGLADGATHLNGG